MTDVLKAMDDSYRKHAAAQRRLAQEHPAQVALGQVIGVALNAWILRRIARRLGVDLPRTHAWFLAGLWTQPSPAYRMLWERTASEDQVEEALKRVRAVVAAVRADNRRRANTAGGTT